MLRRGSGMAILCAVLFQPHLRSAHLCTNGHPNTRSCIDPLDLLALKLYWNNLAVFTKNTAGSSADVTRKQRKLLTSNNCHGNRVVAHSHTQSLTSRVILALMMIMMMIMMMTMMLPKHFNKNVRLLFKYSYVHVHDMYMTVQKACKELNA